MNSKTLTYLVAGGIGYYLYWQYKANQNAAAQLAARTPAQVLADRQQAAAAAADLPADFYI